MAFAPAVPAADRAALRQRLLSEREAQASTPEGRTMEAALADHLRAVVLRLEPHCLGLYWPCRSEFNAPAALAQDQVHMSADWALPFARRSPREMHYRLWDGQAPQAVDECGIAASSGAQTLPDVVLVPCVGYTPGGHRLGYGGGYFDRWLAAHPHVCAVGVAWSFTRLDPCEMAPRAHDVPLTLIVTDEGVI